MSKKFLSLVVKQSVLDMPMPKTEKGKKSLIEAFKQEYGENYELSPWIDPIYDDDVEYTEEEMILERIRLLKKIEKLDDANKEIMKEHERMINGAERC